MNFPEAGASGLGEWGQAERAKPQVPLDSPDFIGARSVNLRYPPKRVPRRGAVVSE